MPSDLNKCMMTYSSDHTSQAGPDITSSPLPVAIRAAKVFLMMRLLKDCLLTRVVSSPAPNLIPDWV